MVEQHDTVLGIDLGAASIGWALIREPAGEGASGEIIAAGVRLFDPAMDGSLEQGREESRNAKRRMARLQRRQTERRARRQRHLAGLLQTNGLLPPGNTRDSQARHDYFLQVDADIIARRFPGGLNGQAHTVPYHLRALAAKERVELNELGRALYHLGQRRGFLSNRKSGGDSEEKGKVYGGISALREEMTQGGHETLGALFANTDPQEKRIRNRYTHREMFRDEFRRIWSEQTKHHGQLLTAKAERAIRKAIFHQRPLKSAKGLIGSCTFETVAAQQLRKDRKRAPWALPTAQRFRILQTVNHLWLEDALYDRRNRSEEERAKLLDALEHSASLTFAQAKKILGFKKGEYTFSLERGGEIELRGNRTAASMRKVFGDAWDTFTPAHQQEIVEDVLSFEHERGLERRGRKHYGLDDAHAKLLAHVALEEQYCALSRQALEKLLPHLEQGLSYVEAATAAYGAAAGFIADADASAFRPPAVASLPPVDHGLREKLRNPTVFKALCELRKVVNGVIDHYGKPGMIRIELARDLKKSRKERNETWKRNREQEVSRKKAAERVLREAGHPNPSRQDIEKALLFEECGGVCPYTGKPIPFASLFGEHPQFDIEHIIPLSRCLDNSFTNKTLCYHEENRVVKKKNTPFEAYGADAEKWEAILQRVRRFAGGRGGKLRRFMLQGEDLETFLNDFTSRDLNDTRYAAKLAARYLSLLYGEDFRKHIQVSTGKVTSELRSAWRLNNILGDGGKKSRADHRHHAVDAIAIALTSRAMVKRASDCAQRAEREGHVRWWKLIGEPWQGFLEQATEVVNRILVSHEVDRRVTGALHQETNYSPVKIDEKGKEWVHRRKPVESLSPAEVEAIVDPAVGEVVKAARANGETPLWLVGDKQLPMRHVRIRVKEQTIPVGNVGRQRNVAPGSNHHIEIVEVQTVRGKRWEGHIVNTYTAYRRKASPGQEIVKRSHGPNSKFIFSLMLNDVIAVSLGTGENKRTEYYIVNSISSEGDGRKRIYFCHVNDARVKGNKSGERALEVKEPSFNHFMVKFRAEPHKLQAMRAQKVTVSPIGIVRRAND